MGASLIAGIQSGADDGGVPKRAAACMKHFIAYSDPENGHDRSPVQLPERVMQNLYRPSFQKAIDQGQYYYTLFPLEIVYLKTGIE